MLTTRNRDSARKPSPDGEPAENTLTAFVAAISLIAAGMAMGGLAGQLDHAFSAIILILPIVGLAAWMYRRRVSGIVGIGGMATWAFTREVLMSEPAWSIMLTFGMSLLILFGTGWLIESLMSARGRALHHARTEPLTGLLNRNAFLDQLQLEVDRSRRRGHPLAAAFLDCDHFKSWNDQHGHMAGDEVLRTIAATLKSSTRSYDALARMGGDEFALLFPELAPETAEATARRVHDDLRRALQSRGWPISISMGLVTYNCPPTTAREVLVSADELMYEAKRLGKDRLATLLDPPCDDDPSTGLEFSVSVDAAI